MEIVLAQSIKTKGFIPFIAQLGSVGDEQRIIVDFEQLRLVSPAGLVSLVAAVVFWLKQKREVIFQNVSACPIREYLQRMDLFAMCGIELHEDFQRHSSACRFVPVQLIGHRVEDMGAEMAACLAPGGDEYGDPMADLYDLAWYVITETANNARQHSEGLGYAAAQVNGKEGLVRIAIADNGKGILKSFQDAGLSWSVGMEDGDAILKALEPRVSSKFGPNNEGVGLTLVSGLARLTYSWLLIISGSGFVRMERAKPPSVHRLPSGARFPGTVIAVGFPQAKVREFAAMLNQAKTDAGLLQTRDNRGMFEA